MSLYFMMGLTGILVTAITFGGKYLCIVHGLSARFFDQNHYYPSPVLLKQSGNSKVSARTRKEIIEIRKYVNRLVTLSVIALITSTILAVMVCRALFLDQIPQ